MLIILRVSILIYEKKKFEYEYVYKCRRIFANIYMLKYWTSISAKQMFASKNGFLVDP